MSKLKSLEELFGGRHFDREIILCVRWYLGYSYLSCKILAACLENFIPVIDLQD
jgi:hypothetical protein